MSQSFSIGNGTYSSNVNYFVNAGGARIQGITVTMVLTGPLIGTSPDGYWSWQLNGYSPPGYSSAYMQWVLSAYFVSNASEVQMSLQNYYVQADDGVIVEDGYTGGSVFPVSELTTGFTMSITVNVNATGNVLGSTGLAKLANGTVVFSGTVSSPACDSNGYVCNPEAPLVGLESQLIGVCCAETATFTQASGVIVYSSVTDIGWSNTPVGLPWVRYNGESGGNPRGTVEKSNIAYGVPS